MGSRFRKELASVGDALPSLVDNTAWFAPTGGRGRPRGARRRLLQHGGGGGGDARCARVDAFVNASVDVFVRGGDAAWQVPQAARARARCGSVVLGGRPLPSTCSVRRRWGDAMGRRVGRFPTTPSTTRALLLRAIATLGRRRLLASDERPRGARGECADRVSVRRSRVAHATRARAVPAAPPRRRPRHSRAVCWCCSRPASIRSARSAPRSRRMRRRSPSPTSSPRRHAPPLLLRSPARASSPSLRAGPPRRRAKVIKSRNTCVITIVPPKYKSPETPSCY